MVSSIILFDLELSTTSLNAKLTFLTQEEILLWVNQVTEPMKHSKVVRKYYNYFILAYDWSVNRKEKIKNVTLSGII